MATVWIFNAVKTQYVIELRWLDCGSVRFGQLWGNIQDHSGRRISILGGDIDHCEKEVRINMCLILDDYRDGAQQCTYSATIWVSVVRFSSGFFFFTTLSRLGMYLSISYQGALFSVSKHRFSKRIQLSWPYVFMVLCLIKLRHNLTFFWPRNVSMSGVSVDLVVPFSRITP